MRTKHWAVALTLMAAVTIGCSGSSVSEVASSAVGDAGLTATLPRLPGQHGATGDAQQTTSAQGVAEKFVPPFPESLDLFSPPKVVVPVVTKDPEPAPVEVAEPVEVEPETPPPPPLRLLGFVDVEGLKALLNVDGKLNVVAIGDSVSGVQIVAVEAPRVTLRHGDQEFEMNLFEQEWFHAAHATGKVFGPQRTFGGRPVRPVGSSGPSLPDAVPQLPGLPQEDGGLRLPKLPGPPGLGDDEADGSLPALPGSGVGEDGDTAPLP